MPATKLLSDNGVTSGITGYQLTGGNDGTLQLQTTTAGGTATTAVTVDNSQNVGIGTSSPSQELHVYRSSGATDILIEQASSGNAYLHTKNTSREYAIGTRTDALAFYDITADAERMRIDSSGNVGIGATPGYGANARLTLYRPSMPELVFADDLTPSAAAAPRIAGGTAYMTFSTNGSERARIDSSGNLLVNTTSQVGNTSSKIQVAFNGQAEWGAGYKTTYAANGSYFNVFINSSNTVIGRVEQNGASTVAYTTSSDYRLKENIAPMTGALSVVQALKPCTYAWKADGSDGQGFIAHELQAVVPDAVVGEKDAVDAEGNPVYQGIDTSFLVATLTAAIQELSAKNDALEARIFALETK